MENKSTGESNHDQCPTFGSVGHIPRCANAGRNTKKQSEQTYGKICKSIVDEYELFIQFHFVHQLLNGFGIECCHQFRSIYGIRRQEPSQLLHFCAQFLSNDTKQALNCLYQIFILKIMIQQFLVLLCFACGESKSNNIQQKSTNANLPTFNSLWESNKHYIEAKKELLLSVDKLKSNVSIDDSAFQELDGYVYFQFIHNLTSLRSPTAQSYLTLGASTEVCHLDEDGVISYQLSLVLNNAKDRKSKWNGNEHLIILKNFKDSDCSSTEFGKYLLPSFDTVEELEMYDNQLLITTSIFREPQKLPIAVKGTLIKVAPKSNENLSNVTAAPYIFAIENNTPIFNSIGRINAKVRDDELSLRLECSIIDSENKLIKYTAMKHSQAITFSQKSTFSNTMIFLTSSPQKNVSTLFYHEKLHTSDLFVSEMQFVEDVSLENVATPHQESIQADLAQEKPTETTETTGNLRGSLKKTTTTDDNYDSYDDVYDDMYDDFAVDYGDSGSKSENVDTNVDTDVITNKVPVYEQLWVATIECI